MFFDISVLIKLWLFTNLPEQSRAKLQIRYC